MKVRIFGSLRLLAGDKEARVQLEAGDTVIRVLQKLAQAQPALGERLLDDEGNLQKAINIMVNGRNIRYLEGLETPLREDDRVALFPAVGGG
jgi:molybdopterin synthase sulfur carrier subunit